MKGRMLKILVTTVLLTVLLVLGGGLLYRHFVTDRIMDKDGMENPFISEMPDEDAAPESQEPEEPNT